MTQNIANHCVRCDSKFDRWADYHAHVTGIPCAKVIRPINTSGRSKTEIVKEWEIKNQGALI